MSRRPIPAVTVPGPPGGLALWSALLPFAWLAVAWWGLDQLARLLMHYWLLQSLDLEFVFWTNFRAGALLFAFALIANAAVVAPAAMHRVPAGYRRLIASLAVMEGLFSGVWLASRYRAFLTIGGVPFDEVDPVFGLDAGFYVFTLPALRIGVGFLILTAALALVSGMAAAWLGRTPEEAAVDRPRLVGVLAAVSSRYTQACIVVLAAASALWWWLARYDLLFMDNQDRSVFTGAAYVDVTGVFSTLVDYHVTAATLFVVGALVALTLDRVRAGRPTRALVTVTAAVLLLDFSFKAAIAVRQRVFVQPNEPVVQLPYIERHIQATRRGYAFDRIETVEFLPHEVGAPLPDADAVLAHPAMRNAPLWPGFASYLEELIDLQHTRRILQTGGDPMVYGPLLEIFRQQQKLRAYYDFIDVDTIRVRDGDETRMLVSALREVPLMEPEPWLAWWGQRFMLFTHGYGLVSASSGGVTPEGEPVYTSIGVPVHAQLPALVLGNQAVYYGEGAGSMAYTNVRDMKELDYPTDEGRAEVVLPPDVRAGVQLDSMLKRLVFGWRSGQFLDIVFSGLITSDTRVHYYRTPLERLEQVAPFLYFDTDPFAVPVDDHVVWMANGIGWTDRYPYSAYGDLGDKSDERSPTRRPEVRVNYARDAVKATVDAYTGEVRLYANSDDPILRTWQAIYPGLIRPREEMPAEVTAQLQYPIQLFHLQFDNLYILYQMEDPMTFFNMEDMWDDGDEVLGPILDSGHAIRFSIEPFNIMVRTGDGLLPRSEPQTQFALAMVFTPESALNLRAIPIVYQDGDSYGRIVSLQVPKGHYFLSPEQADAAIDQEPNISQQITWWNRIGAEVIRGHTSTLLIDGDIFYVEPIFIRSEQNPVTQLKRVCVVFRGKARMGATLEEAVRAAIAAHAVPAVAVDVAEPLPAGEP